jgi:hypothetical protein
MADTQGLAFNGGGRLTAAAVAAAAAASVVGGGPGVQYQSPGNPDRSKTHNASVLE